MIKKENSLVQITLTPQNLVKLNQIQKDLEEKLGITLTKSKVIGLLISQYEIANVKK